MKTYTGKVISLKENEIFVFGSNTQGRHGKGSAKYALDSFGAIYGQAKGLQGQSYAIVTKDLTKKIHPSISKDVIIQQITILYNHLFLNKDITAYVAYSKTGTNLNAYTPKQMAGFFCDAGIIPDNIVFEDGFYNLILECLNNQFSLF